MDNVKKIITVFLSLLVTPIILFITTSNKLFIINQADLSYDSSVLYQFLLFAAVLTVFGALFYSMYKMVPSIQLTKYILWCYFLISPFFITNDHVKNVYRNFVLVCFLMLVFPWTSEIIAKMTYPTASWRWLWMLPLPLAMSVVIGSLPALFKKKGKKLGGYFVVIVLSFIFVLSSKRIVVSEENYTKFGWPSFKLNNHGRILLRPYKEYGVIKNNYIHMESTNKKF